MRAIVYSAVGVTPELTDVPEPHCPDDGAVIAVRATGICRSDWHAWRGHDPVPLPNIPGHEFAGVVSRDRCGGDRVRRRRPGHRPVRERLRALRVVCCRAGAGVPRADAARLHPPRFVRRAGGRACRRLQPRPPARRRRLRHSRIAGLPVRHRVPRPDRPGTPAGRGVARRARVRWGGPVRGDGRRRARRPRRRRRPLAVGPATSHRAGRPGGARGRRRHRRGHRRRGPRLAWTRSAPLRPRRRPSSDCAGVAVMCRSG